MKGVYGARCVRTGTCPDVARQLQGPPEPGLALETQPTVPETVQCGGADFFPRPATRPIFIRDFALGSGFLLAQTKDIRGKGL